VFLGGPVKKTTAATAQNATATSTIDPNEFFHHHSPNSDTNTNTGRTVTTAAATEIPPLNFGPAASTASHKTAGSIDFSSKLNTEINNRLLSAKKDKLTLSKAHHHRHPRESSASGKTSVSKKRHSPKSKIATNSVKRSGGGGGNNNHGKNNYDDEDFEEDDEDNLSIKWDDASLSDEPGDLVSSSTAAQAATASFNLNAKTSTAVPGSALSRLKRKASITKDKQASPPSFNPVRAVDYETTITNIYLNGHHKGSSSKTLSSAGRPKTNTGSRNGAASLNATQQINGFNFLTG
jgi:hypothetical protein